MITLLPRPLTTQPGPRPAPPTPPGQDWRAAAPCRHGDPEAYFPLDPAALAPPECTGCPVRSTCLSEALATRESEGHWGGLSEALLAATLRALPRPKRVKRTEDTIEHGTARGAKQHHRLGSKPCPLCAAAALEQRRARERRTA